MRQWGVYTRVGISADAAHGEGRARIRALNAQDDGPLPRAGAGAGLEGKKIPTNPEAVGSNDSIVVLPVRDVNPGLTLLVVDRRELSAGWRALIGDAEPGQK